MKPLIVDPTVSPAGSVGRTVLAALTVAAALSGCTTTGPGRSSDPASQQQPQGASGVTVFGDIDVNVSRERMR